MGDPNSYAMEVPLTSSRERIGVTTGQRDDFTDLL